MKSKFLSLNGNDFLKGFLFAIAFAILTAIYKYIGNGVFPDVWAEWKEILIAGSGAGILYLLKNLFTNSSGKFLRKEL